MPSTSPAESSTRPCAPASRSWRSSARCSPASPTARSRASTSRCAARSPSSTSACSSSRPSRASSSNIVSETVSYVNAPLLAEQRGVDRAPHHRAGERGVPQPAHDPRRAERRHRRSRSRAPSPGTKQIEKIVEINGYDVEVPIAEHLIVMIYTDRPGIVAVYGKEFGEADINIAGMQIARHERGRPGAQRADRRLAGARGAAREGARRDRRRPPARDRHHRASANATKGRPMGAASSLTTSGYRRGSSLVDVRRSVTLAPLAGSTPELHGRGHRLALAHHARMIPMRNTMNPAPISR